jgi:alcohol dehydrogenase class IV
MRFNRPVCEGAMARLGEVLTKRKWPTTAVAADAAVRAIENLCAAVHVPVRLSEIGVRPEQIPDLVRDSRGNSMNGNPRPATDAELTRLLEEML